MADREPEIRAIFCQALELPRTASYPTPYDSTRRRKTLEQFVELY